MFVRLLLTGVLAIGFASAQEGMGGRGGGSGGGGRGVDMGAPNPSARRATKLEQAVDKLKLSKEQKEEFANILSAAAERAGSVRMELDKARAEIAGAIIDGKPANDVASATAAYAAVSAKMTKVETDAFAKVYAILKPNQQSKFDQAFELLSGMFSGPARGGAGGAAGRGMGRGRGESR